MTTSAWRLSGRSPDRVMDEFSFYCPGCGQAWCGGLCIGAEKDDLSDAERATEKRYDSDDEADERFNIERMNYERASLDCWSRCSVR